MRKRDAWIERVKAVEVEFRVAGLALDALRERLRADPGLLPRDIDMADVRRTADALEETYFVRLYAVFEAGLREAWRLALNRDTQPPMRDLLDGFTASCDIPDHILKNAQTVRELRNSLVHDQNVLPGRTLSIGECRRHLTRFFSYLPPEW